MENTHEAVCIFCKLPADIQESRILLEADEASICSDCATVCYDSLQKALGRNKPIKELDIKKPTLTKKPSEIVEFLDKFVIGQDKAKRILSVAISNHYKMLDYKSQKVQPVDLQKSNVLMAGPTGSGKTFILKQIAKILDVPFAQADATSLTEAGYVGDDVETVLRKLVEASNGDIKRAERGIVYIDEIDKLSRKGENLSISRDVSGEGVQQALLKLIEGSVVEVPEKGMRKHPTGDTFKIDTTNILFIVGGSFEGIEKVIAKRVKKDVASIGFGAEVESKKEANFNDNILNIRQEDLKKFGMLPELLGRLPIIAPLQELDREALRRIITEPNDALLKQYQVLFESDGVELAFTEDAIDAVADLAIERKTGARSLRSIMEETLLDHMYELPDKENIKRVLFTKEAVLKEAPPTYEYKQEDAS